MTGTYIINKIVNLFTMNIPRFLYKVYRFLYVKYTKKELSSYEDPWFVKGNFKFLELNYFPFEYFKRKLLLFQIRNHFKHISNEDLAF